ncbi:protein TORNADO 2 [Sesamum alatum]|uniref:Protein TORNADO 2 n=1 Tax=Sesamum alatum TaxID=300844 RepID=A0AAE1Y3E8_9LAMI|nr:protein TORNADO 2 [Sesamum alatum]
MALSSNVIGAINFVAMILSIPIIGAGIWLATEADNSCVKILQWPVIILGVLILVVALAGFIGGFWRIPWLLIFLPHCDACSDCPSCMAWWFLWWLRRRVRSSYKWDRIRSCLSSSSMCAELNQSYRMAQDFFNAHISPLQSGCCKPPTECGYTFVNPTYWISPINTAADMDCLQWSNDQTQLCYSCNSCKAGLLANIKKEWRRADIILLFTLVALICVYLIGCCAFRNAKTEELFRKYKQGNPYN